jgi:hyperosmotically inducible periplasmic protein
MSNRKMKGLSLCLALGIAGIAITGCAPTRYTRGPGEYVEDKALSTRVNTALFRDPAVSGFDVNVQSWRGQVQLTGFVDTEQQKERAEQIVRNVPGVEWVRNDLIVKTQMPGAIGTGEIREPAGAPPGQQFRDDPRLRDQQQFRDETRIREQQPFRDETRMRDQQQLRQPSPGVQQQGRIGAGQTDGDWQRGVGATDPVREAREEAEFRAEAAGAPPVHEPQARRPGADQGFREPGTARGTQPMYDPQARPQTFQRPGATGDADQMLEQRVRQELQRDQNLSPEARNIQITTQNGRVIIRGQVGSEAERQAITERVREIVVEDQLQVRR